MDNTVSIIVSALASGILATIITLFWQSYIQKKRTENDRESKCQRITLV